MKRYKRIKQYIRANEEIMYGYIGNHMYAVSPQPARFTQPTKDALGTWTFLVFGILKSSMRIIKLQRGNRTNPDVRVHIILCMTSTLHNLHVSNDITKVLLPKCILWTWTWWKLLFPTTISCKSNSCIERCHFGNQPPSWSNSDGNKWLSNYQPNGCYLYRDSLYMVVGSQV
jgi:hypothetical protein